MYTRLLCSAFAASAVCLGSALLAYTAGYRVNLTPSVPVGVYQLTNEPLTRGALVAACLPKKIARFGHERGYLDRGECPGGVQAILKPVVALAGDTIELQPGCVAVNGVQIPRSAMARHDKKGRQLPHMEWGQYRVNTGEVWVVSTEATNSWDSRYYGPIPQQLVIGTAEKVWIWQ